MGKGSVKELVWSWSGRVVYRRLSPTVSWATTRAPRHIRHSRVRVEKPLRATREVHSSERPAGWAWWPGRGRVEGGCGRSSRNQAGHRGAWRRELGVAAGALAIPGRPPLFPRERALGGGSGSARSQAGHQDFPRSSGAPPSQQPGAPAWLGGARSPAPPAWGPGERGWCAGGAPRDVAWRQIFRTKA